MRIVGLTPAAVRRWADDLCALDANLDEEPWSIEQFLLDLPGKWDLSVGVENDGRLLAFLICSRKQNFLWVHRGTTGDSVRGSGAYKALHYRAALAAKNLGLRRLAAYTRRHTTEIVQFLKKMGCEEDPKISAFGAAKSEDQIPWSASLDDVMKASSRIASIHQPNFVPWLGVLDKVASSEVFVSLDTVQFVRREWQNRCNIRRGDQKQLLTVPVVRGPRETAIKDVVVDHSTKWQSKIIGSLRHAYARAPFCSEVLPRFEEVLSHRAEHLVEVNQRVFDLLIELLGLRVRVVRASELPVTTADPSKRLAELTASCFCTHYLSGYSGREYMDQESFDGSGVSILFQDASVRERTYQQQGEGFIAGLAILDALFNVGPEGTKALLKR